MVEIVTSRNVRALDASAIAEIEPYVVIAERDGLRIIDRQALAHSFVDTDAPAELLAVGGGYVWAAEGGNLWRLTPSTGALLLVAAIELSTFLLHTGTSLISVGVDGRIVVLNPSTGAERFGRTVQNPKAAALVLGYLLVAVDGNIVTFQIDETHSRLVEVDRLPVPNLNDVFAAKASGTDVYVWSDAHQIVINASDPTALLLTSDTRSPEGFSWVAPSVSSDERIYPVPVEPKLVSDNALVSADGCIQFVRFRYLYHFINTGGGYGVNPPTIYCGATAFTATSLGAGLWTFTATTRVYGAWTTTRPGDPFYYENMQLAADDDFQYSIDGGSNWITVLRGANMPVLSVGYGYQLSTRPLAS